MPQYLYACNLCKHEVEKFQNIKDKPLKKCPVCKHLSLERIIFPVFGKVSRTRDEMGSLQDLAKFNRDKMTKTEKEKADYEVSQSRLVKHKIEKEKDDKPWYKSKHSKEIGQWTSEEMLKYVKDGSTPERLEIKKQAKEAKKKQSKKIGKK